MVFHGFHLKAGKNWPFQLIFALGFWGGGEERGKVHSKFEAMSKNKSLRTSPAKTTKGWHRALGTETTAIFLSPMVSRDYVVSDSAVGKCLRGAPQTSGGLSGQEANRLLLAGSLSSYIKKSCYKITISRISSKSLYSPYLSAVKPQSVPRGSHVVFSVVGIKIWEAWRYWATDSECDCKEVTPPSCSSVRLVQISLKSRNH